MDLSPVAESAVHHGKVTSREEEGECPDHGQKCTTCDTTLKRHS